MNKQHFIAAYKPWVYSNGTLKEERDLRPFQSLVKQNRVWSGVLGENITCLHPKIMDDADFYCITDVPWFGDEPTVIW